LLFAQKKRYNEAKLGKEQNNDSLRHALAPFRAASAAVAQPGRNEKRDDGIPKKTPLSITQPAAA